MKFTMLSILALAAAIGVSALPSDSAAVRAREIDVMSQFASLHMLDRRALSNGKKCKEDSQCDSEFCKKSWFRSNVCEAKLSNGQECDDDKHCSSGYCKRTSFFRAKKCDVNTIPKGSLDKGAKCDRNVDCKSQICEEGYQGYFKKCVIRETGENCSQNSHCESGFCFIKPVGNNHRCLAVNLPKGKPCVRNVQCASNKCSNFCE